MAGGAAKLKGAARRTARTARSDLRASKTFGDAVLDEKLSSDDDVDEMAVMRTVQMIGGAVVGIAVIAIVVNELLTTDAVANSSGPFDGVIDSLGTTGVAAMSLLVIGLLVAAASRIMDFFGGGF